MAGLIPLWVEGCPSLGPQAAILEGGQRHHGFGIRGIPASTAAFDAMSSGLALGFRRAAADLPALLAKLNSGYRIIS